MGNKSKYAGGRRHIDRLYDMAEFPVQIANSFGTTTAKILIRIPQSGDFGIQVFQTKVKKSSTVSLYCPERNSYLFQKWYLQGQSCMI